MHRPLEVARLVIPAIAVVLATATVQAQVDQHALAQRIFGGDTRDRSQALEQARLLGPRQTGADLRAALITLLERNNRIVMEAERRNETLDTFVDPEFVAQVAHVVSQLQHPQAIPALAGALGTGSTLVPDALADFGEQAAAAVLRVVTSPESTDEAVNDGLISLRFMVEGTGTPRISAGTLGEIRLAAKQLLTGKHYFTTVWDAIDLAVALDNAELRRIVESLATDRDNVRARGIEDPDLIERTQKRAADRLAGARPMPRYRSPEERARQLDPRRQR